MNKLAIKGGSATRTHDFTARRTMGDTEKKAVMEVMESGELSGFFGSPGPQWLGGEKVKQFERKWADNYGYKHAISVNSWTTGLMTAVGAMGIGPGDEVIVSPYTMSASATAILFYGGIPVFVDIDPKTYNICPEAVESSVTSRTRAILPVHLFGQCAAMDEIAAIAKKHDLPVIEDAAQAIGAEYLGRPAGSWGDIGCLSFYPTKNLGGMGDGGMMVCNDLEMAAKLRLLASHGMQPRYYHKLVGINSRLDTIQAAILNVKIAHLQSYSDARQKNANRYAELFAASGLTQWFALPYHAPEALHVWNQYGIRVPDGMRDSLRKHLSDMGIGNEVYYPVPLHQQECFRDLGYTDGCLPQTEKAAKEILHLPIYPDLTESEQDAVVNEIQRFYASASLRRAA